MITRITADLSNWSQRAPSGIIAESSEGVMSEYCDDVKDFIDFIEEVSDKICDNTELVFVVSAEDIEFCADAVKEIRETFRRIKK